MKAVRLPAIKNGLPRFLVVLLTIVALPVLAADLLEDWKLVKDRKEIQVYMRHTDDSTLKSFRGVTVFRPDEPFSAVAALTDFENNHRVFHFVSDIEQLEITTPTNRLVRVHTHLPWPLKDREAIARILITQDPETLQLRARFRQEESDLPVQDGYVRVPDFNGNLVLDLLDDGNVQATYEIVLDPGGYIPLWMVDMVLKDTPYFTLRRMRRFVDKDEYQGHRFEFIRYPDQVTEAASN